MAERQVDFYVLDHSSEDERRRFAARLLDKIQKLGKSAMVLVPDADAAAEMDRLLWEFPPESFLPHAQAGTDDAPILIGPAALWEQARGDVIINLRLEPVKSADKWERLVEIVVQEPQVLDATRRHYKFYRSQGFQIESHTLRGG